MPLAAVRALVSLVRSNKHMYGRSIKNMRFDGRARIIRFGMSAIVVSGVVRIVKFFLSRG